MQGNRNIIIGGVVVVLALILYGASRGGDEVQVTPENLSNNVETTSKTQTATKTTTKPAVTTPTISSDGYYLISYGASGFSPKNLTIARGKSVRFTNNSSNAMRIVTADASNPLTQAINQAKTVGRGGVYDYTFNESGTFNYMNYNKTVDRGVITVN